MPQILPSPLIRLRRAGLAVLDRAARHASWIRTRHDQGNRTSAKSRGRSLAWIRKFEAGPAGGARREREAFKRLCEVLRMEPQAAKDAARVPETCLALDPEVLLEAARLASQTRTQAPPHVRANLITVVRRLRDARQPELAHIFADMLTLAGDAVLADRERMLIHLDQGDARRALAECEALISRGHAELIRPIGAWMLVRIRRAPRAEGAVSLAGLLIRNRLLPPGAIEQTAGMSELIATLAEVRGRGERPAADDDEIRAAAAAYETLDAIEAAIAGVESPGPPLELIRIRLLGVMGRFEEAFQAMAAYSDSHAISRDAAASFGLIMDRYLRARHSSGSRMDLVAPLLDEAIFADYLPRMGDEEGAIWNAWPFARNIQTALASQDDAPPDSHETPVSLRRSDPRTRVLVICSNWKFISPLIERMELEADVDLVFRTFDFRSLTLVHPAAHPNRFFFFDRDASAAAWKAVRAAAPDFADLVDWADVVMVEWANQPAVVFSQILPSNKRLVVRLHSYEAFSNWHYFIDWTRVDEAAFVADHVRSIFFTQNRLARQAGLKTMIVSNRQDFEQSIPRRDRTARLTICMLGWATANKDPIFALEILQALRADGGDWRLRLVGADWRPQAESLEAEYRARFESMIRNAELAGAIDLVPHTDSPLSELGRAAYVISASHREGTHESIIEGLAVGCLPVIRDWPMVAAFGGARSQYAAFSDRIVQSPEEAAELILEFPWTQKRGQMMRERARDAYGTQKSIAALKRFLKG